MRRDNKATRYTPETRERAVRMVLDNQGNYRDRSAAIRAIAPKIGCGLGSLRRWVALSEIDHDRRNGIGSGERVGSCYPDFIGLS